MNVTSSKGRVAYAVVQQDQTKPIFAIMLMRENTPNYIIQNQFGTFKNKESAETIVRTLNQEMGISQDDATLIFNSTQLKKNKAWMAVQTEDGFRIALIQGGVFGYTTPVEELFKNYESANRGAKKLNEELGLTDNEVWKIINSAMKPANIEHISKAVNDCPVFYIESQNPDNPDFKWEVRLKLKDEEFILVTLAREQAANIFVTKFRNAWMRHFYNIKVNESKQVAPAQPSLNLRNKKTGEQFAMTYGEIVEKFKQSSLFVSWKKLALSLEMAMRELLAGEQWLNSIYIESEFQALHSHLQKDTTVTSKAAQIIQKRRLEK